MSPGTFFVGNFTRNKNGPLVYCRTFKRLGGMKRNVKIDESRRAIWPDWKK